MTKDNFLAAVFTLLKRIFQNLFKAPFIGVARSVQAALPDSDPLALPGGFIVVIVYLSFSFVYF